MKRSVCFEKNASECCCLLIAGFATPSSTGCFLISKKSIMLSREVLFFFYIPEIFLKKSSQMGIRAKTRQNVNQLYSACTYQYHRFFEFAYDNPSHFQKPCLKNYYSHHENRQQEKNSLPTYVVSTVYGVVGSRYRSNVVQLCSSDSLKEEQRYGRISIPQCGKNLISKLMYF